MDRNSSGQEVENKGDDEGKKTGCEKLKSKTPVARLRELALLNNMKLDFVVTKEEGPQHDKSFNVTLTVETRTWHGRGKSIKKAQVDAATKALKEFDFPKAVKAAKKKKVANPSSLTPTVMLNGLAMAHGLNVSYKVNSKVPLPCQLMYDHASINNSIHQCNPSYAPYGPQSFSSPLVDNHFTNCFHQPKKRWIYPHLYRIEVTVGECSIIGEGKTQQAARHNAAEKAYEQLKSMPIMPKSKTSHNEHTGKVSKQLSTHDIGENGKLKQTNCNKSSISTLYETASAHRLQVDFKMTTEQGPPHLKSFLVEAVITNPNHQSTCNSAIEINISAEAWGSNKKAAKNLAAEAALEKLGKLQLPPRLGNAKNKIKTSREEIKPMHPQSSLHPVSRLMQIMQAKREKEPTFTLVSVTNVSRKNTKFSIECTLLEHKTQGEGLSKREAKRVASENMLKKLGFLPDQVDDSIVDKQPGKSILKNNPKLQPVENGNSKQYNFIQRVKFKNSTALKNSKLPALLESGQELNGNHSQ